MKAILQEIEAKILRKTLPTTSLTDETIQALENGQANQSPLLRQWVAWFTGEINKIAPELAGKTGDEILVAALDNSERLIYEFSRIAEAVAITGSEKSAETLSQIYSFFLEHYNPTRGFAGSFSDADFDFFKFLGHETFVTFYALLIREEQWDLIALLLDKGIYVEVSREGVSDLQPFDEIAAYLWWLERRNERLKLGRLLLHADILNTRHTEGMLAGIVSMREFVDADYFLYLRAEFVDPYEKFNTIRWRAWSLVYMRDTPVYLVKSIDQDHALKLLAALGLTTVEEFKEKFAERGYAIESVFQRRNWAFGLRHFDPSRIAIK